MSERAVAFSDVESCVEATLTRIGRHVRLGTPLGLGKANHLVNEFFRRAREDPRLDLSIFTALTLGRPRWKSDLERRFVEPLVERLFRDYPELAYVVPLRRGELPDDIRVSEFYFRSPCARRIHASVAPPGKTSRHTDPRSPVAAQPQPVFQRAAHSR